MNISITCTGCSKPFTSTNLPRISTRCYHTYCEYCLTRLHGKLIGYVACPMDRQPFDIVSGFHQFPLNRSLAKLIGLKVPTEPLEEGKSDEKQRQGELCLLHGKEADLVCIDHAIRICSNCALFGQHKQHRIRTVDNVIEECTNVGEQTVTIMAEIQSMEQKTSSNTMGMLKEQAFRERRENLSKVIKAKFFRVIERLKRAQDVALQQLDDILNEEKALLKNSYRPEEIATKRKLWFRDAEALGLIVDNICCRKKIEEATVYLDDKQEESRIVKRGQYLIVEMNSSEKVYFDKIAAVLEDVNQETDANFENMIVDYCKIYKTSDRNKPVFVEPPKTDRQDDDFLLDELNRIHSVESAKSEEFTPGAAVSSISLHSASDNTTQPMDIPMLQMERLEISTPSFIVEKSERTVVGDRSFVKEPLGHLPSNLEVNRRKKKMKIPEKYEAIVEDLRCDRAECVDLTNAELGDAVILQLCDYIRNSTKLRSLKLIRNKLSDQAFPQLMEACTESRISSLNLGQNLLTDKALDVLAKCELKELRALTLSQNRINQRNCKNKVAEFKKMGLTVSI